MLHSPVRFLVLSVLMFGLWLLLSGVYIPRLIITGGIASLAVAYIVDRAGLLDREGVPVEFIPRGVVYWLWLMWEIIKSSVNVTKIILSPRLPISPTMITFNPSQKTDMGRVTHANSITLTPGTIAVGISSSENTIQVHAIEKAGALDCVGSDMDKRVVWFEGEKE